MTFKKTINLTAYEVEYIDQRQEKPRTVQQETVAAPVDLAELWARTMAEIQAKNPEESEVLQ